MKRGNWTGAACLIAAVACGGCSEVKGSVTDIETGAPIVGARVGLVVLPPFGFVTEFREEARTDSSGAYRFSHAEADPRVSARAGDYLTVTKSLAGPAVGTVNFQLRSIADIKGIWVVTIQVAGESLAPTEFHFGEDGMEWRAGAGFLGDVRYTFDGMEIGIDDALAAGDAIFGELQTTLVINDAGDALIGDITFFHSHFTEADCDPCAGTVEAVRPGT